MEKVCKSFSHSEFGDVRVIFLREDFPVYCASDVARMLGFRDPQSAVRNHCRFSEKLHYKDERGNRPMRFISDTDVARLCDAAFYDDAEEIYAWLVYMIPVGERDTRKIEHMEQENGSSDVAVVSRSELNDLCESLSEVLSKLAHIGVALYDMAKE